MGRDRMKTAVVASLVVFCAATVLADAGVHMLEETSETPSAVQRAAALAKVRALIAPKSKSKGTAGLAAKLKQVQQDAKKKIAKYKFLASTAAKKEDIRLRAKLSKQKEVFIKKTRYAGTYKAKLAKVAKRAAKAVAEADVQADKEKAKLKAFASKASYAKAAEKTIGALQSKLKSSGKATNMVVAKLKVDEKKISKLRATITGLKGGLNSQASKVAKAKEKKSKAKKKVTKKVKNMKKKAKKKTKTKVKKKAKKASKHKGKVAKHKAKAAKAKVKASKAKAKASKHKAKASKHKAKEGKTKSAKSKGL